MPVIPSEFVQTVMPQGQEAQIQGVQASPQDFGAGVGQGLQQAGNELAENTLRMQNLRNETVASQADADLTRALVDLQWNPNKDAATGLPQGYNNRMGKDAIDSYGDIAQQVEALRQSYLGNLENDAQRKMVASVFQRRTAAALESMSAHAAAQNRVWQKETLADRAKATMDNMTADSLNPKTWGQGIATLNDIASQISDLEGTGTDGANAHASDFRDQVWKNRVTQVASSNASGPIVAQNLYQQGVDSGQISGMARSEIEQHLKAPVQAWQARDFVNGLVGGGDLSNLPQGMQQPAGKLNDNQIAVGKQIYAGFSQAGYPDSAAAGAVSNAFRESSLNPSNEKGDSGTSHFLAQWHDPDRLAGLNDLAQSRGEAKPSVKTQIDYMLQELDSPQYAQAKAALMGAKTERQAADALMVLYEKPANPVLGVSPLVADQVTSGADNVPQQVGDQVVFPTSAGQNVPQRGSLIAPAAPAPGKMRVEDYEAALPGWEQAVINKYPDNPVAQAQAMGILHTTVGAQIATLKKTAQADVSYIERAIVDPKGAPDLNTFLQDPNNAEVYNRLLDSNPSAIYALNNQFKDKAKGEPTPRTPQTEARYDELYHEAVYDPDTFTQRNLAVEKGQVPDDGLTKLINLKDAIIAHDASQEGKTMRLKSALDIAQTQAVTAGIYELSKSDKQQPKSYQAFVTKFAGALDQFQQDNNRPPKPPEVKQMATDLLQQAHLPGYFGGTDVRLYNLTPNQETRALMPKDAVAGAQEDFKKVYGRDPFPGELDQLYFATKLHPGDKDLLRKVDAQVRQNSLRLIPVSPRTGEPLQPSKIDTGRALQEQMSTLFNQAGLPPNPNE